MRPGQLWHFQCFREAKKTYDPKKSGQEEDSDSDFVTADDSPKPAEENDDDVDYLTSD
jgi:hypothetical protein